MKVNYVLLYGTPYLKYKVFESFEDVSEFLLHKGIVDYSIFKKLEDKEEIEMIYRDNDIRHLRKENQQLKKQKDDVVDLIKRQYKIRNYYEYEECGYDEYNYDDDFKEELLIMLGEIDG